MSIESIEVEGLHVAYRRAGHGPPLVLLHGAWVDGRAWRHQLETLSDEFTVVAWDAPGFGASADPPEGFRLPEYADVLASFIAILGLGRPHILGISFGGGLALELYRRHPTVPRTLLLASAYAGWAGSLPPNIVRQRLERALQEAEHPAEHVREFVPDLFTASASPADIEEIVALMSEAPPAGMRAFAHSFAEADLRDVLPRIAVPTLLLYGDADVRSPLRVAHELNAAIPGSQLVVMRGVGHMSNVDAPVRFDAEVRSFLRSVAS